MHFFVVFDPLLEPGSLQTSLNDLTARVMNLLAFFDDLGLLFGDLAHGCSVLEGFLGLFSEYLLKNGELWLGHFSNNAI